MSRAKLRRGRPPAGRRVQVPLPGPRLRRALVIGLPLAGLAGGIAAFLAWGGPARVQAGLALETAAAGFEIHHVEIIGAREVPRLAVYETVLSGVSNPLLGTDIAAIRTRLLDHPWVADASVSRRLPDTLVVRLSERTPVALWQHGGRFHLIDAGGRVLASDRLERFARLPLVVGAGANFAVADWLKLVEAAPALAPAIEAGVLVSGRRWNIRFKSGETLALPDETSAARAALARFASLDAELPAHQKLLGGRFQRFDMRLPGQLIVGGPEVQKALEAAAQDAARRKAATI